jgi:peptide/nickel transport system substrate-binding protein
MPRCVKHSAWLRTPKKITEAAWGKRARSVTEPPLGLLDSQVQTAHTPAVAEAVALLNKGGWELQADGLRHKGAVTLRLTLLTSDSPSFRVAAELIKQSWQTLGVEVTITNVPASNLVNDYVRPRKYDALLFSERMSINPDPFPFWHSSQTKDPGLNVSEFSSSEADKLIVAARTEPNQAEQTKLYKQLTELLKSEVPAIYLNQSFYTYFIDESVENVDLKVLPDPTWRLGLASDYYAETTRTWKR